MPGHSLGQQCPLCDKIVAVLSKKGSTRYFGCPHCRAKFKITEGMTIFLEGEYEPPKRTNVSRETFVQEKQQWNEVLSCLSALYQTHVTFGPEHPATVGATGDLIAAYDKYLD